MYQYHRRLLMHFTTIKPLNLPHYLFRSLVKIMEKVQRKGKDHETIFFHCGLVKFMLLQNLSEINVLGKHSSRQFIFFLLLVNLVVKALH